MTRYRFSGFEADIESKELRRNGCRVPIQPQPLLILCSLLEARGEVVSREALIEAVWGSAYLADPSHSLNIAMRKLRTALEDSPEAPRFIETVARKGYRFIGEVEAEVVVEEPALPAPEHAVPEIAVARPSGVFRWGIAIAAVAVATLSAWVWLPRGHWSPLVSVVSARANPAQGPQTRLVWDQAVDLGGQVSSDGRYFSYTDWDSEDLGLAVRDLFAGQNRKVARMGPYSKTKTEVGPSAVSPDGKMVAFSYTTYADRQENEVTRLAVIGIDGSNQRVLLEGGGLDYAHPFSWSSDGKWIAASVVYRGQKPGGRDSLALVSLDGQVRHLDVKDELWAYNSSFSPDGKYLAYSVRARKMQPVLIVRCLDAQSRELAVQNNAMMMGWAPDGTAILFSRAREATHDLFLLPIASGIPAGDPSPVYTSSDVGQVPAGITRDGTLHYSTFNRRAETVIVPQTGSGAPVRLEGEVAASVAGSVSIGVLLGSGPAHFSPDGKRVVAVTAGDALLIRDMESGGQRTIDPDLKEWKAVRWSPDQSGLLVLGSTDDGRFGVFRVDDTTGKATALLAKLPPETWTFTPSKDGGTIYHGTPLKTQARHLASGKDEVLFEHPQGGNYDLRVSRDGGRLAIRGGSYLAVVDLRSRQRRLLYERIEPEPVALWAMDWSADDGELLVIARPGVGMDRMELWRFSPEGGKPRRQPIAPELRGLAVSPDGKYAATTRLTQRWQLWAIDGFLTSKVSQVFRPQ